MEDPQMKKCTRCGETKALGEFVADRHNKSGKAARCKKCERARVKAYYRASETYRQAMKRGAAQWARANPEKMNACQKAKREKQKQKDPLLATRIKAILAHPPKMYNKLKRGSLPTAR